MPNEFEGQPNQEVGATDQEKLDAFRDRISFEKTPSVIPDEEVIAQLDKIDFRKIPEFSRNLDRRYGMIVAEDSTVIDRDKNDPHMPKVHYINRSVFYDPRYGLDKHGIESEAEVTHVTVNEFDGKLRDISTRTVSYKKENGQWSLNEGIIHSVQVKTLEKLGFKLERIKE